MSKGLFIVGTGTDVGKTYVTALIVKSLENFGEKAAYYKAAMSGNERGADGGLIAGDAEKVKSVSGISQPVSTMCPYVYENAYSPHLAALTEGNPVELETVMLGYNALESKYDYITAEGSGGIVCPLRCDGRREIYLTDVIKELGLPCLLVADAGLGTINAVTLTVRYMQSLGLETAGVVFNRFVAGDPICENNVIMCEKLTGIRTVAKIEPNAKQFPADVRGLYKERKNI